MAVPEVEVQNVMRMTIISIPCVVSRVHVLTVLGKRHPNDRILKFGANTDMRTPILALIHGR